MLASLVVALLWPIAQQTALAARRMQSLQTLDDPHPDGNFSSNSRLPSMHNNITRILDTILLNQDKHFRPQNEDDDGIRRPLVVEVDILVRSMGPISEKDMEFSMNCYFRQKWLDRRLAFSHYNKSDHIPLASKTLKDIWVPDTYIRNGRRSYLHTLTVPNVLFRVRNDGEVHVSQRLTIKTRCKMFFKKFPMDVQACPIEIGSLGHYSNELKYVWKQVKLDSDLDTDNTLSQYKVLDVVQNSLELRDVRDPDRNVSVLVVYFKLERQQGFYILQIYTPCTLLVVMSWVSFWINKEASPARVALGIMTVLSMSTLGFGLRTDLPKVSHSTALDVYVLVCFGFVFAAMIEYAVINYAQLVYIRKRVHDLQGLQSNQAMEGMRLFGIGILGAAAATTTPTTTTHSKDLEKKSDENNNTEKHSWWRRNEPRRQTSGAS